MIDLTASILVDSLHTCQLTKLLLYQPYIVVSVVPQDRQTALIFAIQEHHTETVKMLLAVGADVNLQEKVKNTKAIYVGVDACVYPSFLMGVRNIFHAFLEKFSVTNFECLSKFLENSLISSWYSVTNFECLSHTLKVSREQFHKLLIQSCSSPWYVESLCLSRPQVEVLCFMEQRKVTLRWWNSWPKVEPTSASRTR